jgi:Holliday junction DNA helicase RuvA
MIAQLRGKLAGRGVHQAVLDVGGVGYLVNVPDRCLPSGLAVGEELTLYTWLSVREDALELFGFSSPQDREFFKLLISINGIGPRAGLNILSSMDAGALATAIVKGDDARLTRVQGVGKKTAARIVLELREKVNGLASGGGGGVASEAGDVLEVLEGLGCRPDDARAAVEKVCARAPGLSFDDLLAESLAALSAGRRN